MIRRIESNPGIYSKHLSNRALLDLCIIDEFFILINKDEQGVLNILDGGWRLWRNLVSHTNHL